MGWTTLYRQRGLTNKQWLQEHYFGGTGVQHNGHKYEVLETSQARGDNTLYGAVRHTYPDGTSCVFGLVFLTQWYPRDPYYNYGYKDMDETCGPYECNCPAKILDLLTPTDSQWANEWRQKCRENLARRAARPALRVGLVIHTKPIRFTDGHTYSMFRIKNAKRFIVSPILRDGSDGWNGYRISRRDYLNDAVVVTEGEIEAMRESYHKRLFLRHAFVGLY